MRRSFWILLVVILVVIGAPRAQADSGRPIFTYTYTDPDFGVSWTTFPIFEVTTVMTTVLASDLDAASTSGLSAGCRISSVVLNLGGIGNTKTSFSGCVFNSSTIVDEFVLTDYDTPGTYMSPSIPSDTLVVTAAPVLTPEFGTAGLTLIGVGVLFAGAMRKSKQSRLRVT